MLVSVGDIGSTVTGVVPSPSSWLVELGDVASLWMVKLKVVTSLSGSPVLDVVASL